MNWLIFSFILELGIIPSGSFLMYEKIPNGYYRTNPIYLQSSFFTNMEVELEFFKHIYIGGGAKTILYYGKGGWWFDPQAVDYKFEYGLRFGIIDIFFLHHCIHPIMTYMYWYNANLIWEGWYNEIGIRIKGKIGGG